MKMAQLKIILKTKYSKTIRISGTMKLLSLGCAAPLDLSIKVPPPSPKKKRPWWVKVKTATTSTANHTAQRGQNTHKILSDGPNHVMFYPLLTMKATSGNVTKFKPYLSSTVLNKVGHDSFTSCFPCTFNTVFLCLDFSENKTDVH